jgi:hypothetical protein
MVDRVEKGSDLVEGGTTDVPNVEYSIPIIVFHQWGGSLPNFWMGRERFFRFFGIISTYY